MMFYVDWFNSYVTKVTLKGERYVIYFFSAGHINTTMKKHTSIYFKTLIHLK